MRLLYFSMVYEVENMANCHIFTTWIELFFCSIPMIQGINNLFGLSLYATIISKQKKEVAWYFLF